MTGASMEHIQNKKQTAFEVMFHHGTCQMRNQNQ